MKLQIRNNKGLKQESIAKLIKMNCIFEGYVWQEFKTDIFASLVFLALLLMAGLGSIEFEHCFYLIWGLSLFGVGALEFAVLGYFCKTFFNRMIQKYLKEVEKKQHIK